MAIKGGSRKPSESSSEEELLAYATGIDVLTNDGEGRGEKFPRPREGDR